MNQKQARLFVLNSVFEYQVPIAQAAELLGVSPRHVRRMVSAYLRNRAAALAHGNRGRRPHNATSFAEAAAVMELATQRYAGSTVEGRQSHPPSSPSCCKVPSGCRTAGGEPAPRSASGVSLPTKPCRRAGPRQPRPSSSQRHFVREGIDLSRPTVRRILTRAGIGSPRSRGARRNTVSAVSGFPRRGCWCNWTAAITPGWRTGDPNSPCCWPWTTPPERWRKLLTILNAMVKDSSPWRGSCPAEIAHPS